MILDLQFVFLDVIFQIFIVIISFLASSHRALKALGRSPAAGLGVAVQGDLTREFLLTARPEVRAGNLGLELRGQALESLPLLVVLALAGAGVGLHLGLTEEEEAVAALSQLPGLLVEAAVLRVERLLEK